MSGRFTRVIEDFKCERCGQVVSGNGYTNHCTACLWSKHVDVNPGDRASDCQGLMRPVSVQQMKGAWILTHKCIKCGHVKPNKMARDDDFEAALSVVRCSL